MAKNTRKTLAQGYKSAIGVTVAMSAVLMEGAIYPSFSQGMAATAITWFRTNFLESGWIVLLCLVALLSGVAGMIVAETKVMKVVIGIMVAILAAFLGADQILALVTAKLF